MVLLRDLPEEKLTPSHLWAELDPETRKLAAQSVYSDAWEEQSARTEANHAIASALRYREQAVRRLPLEKRVDYLVRAVRPDDSLARSLLLALHLTQRTELLEAFLDSLGVPQSGGVIDDDFGPVFAAFPETFEGFIPGFPCIGLAFDGSVVSGGGLIGHAGADV